MDDVDDVMNMKNKYFSRIEDEDAALLTLKRMATGLSDVVIWTKGQQTVLRTKLSGYTEDKGLIRAIIPRGMERHEVVAALKGLRDQEIFFCVISTRGNIFFRTKYDSFNQEQMRFSRPEEVFKVQRRKHLRMRVHDNVQLSYLEPNSNEGVSNRILDISAGGAAILVPLDHGEHYTIGCELKLLSFRMRDTEVTASAVVRYLVELPKTSRIRGIKCGVEFTEISEASIQVIMSYILEKEVPRDNPFTK